MRFPFHKPLVGATTLAVLVASAGIAQADNIQNNATASGNNDIVAGGDTTDITYSIQATNGDGGPSGQAGICNASSTSPVSVNIVTPAGVTASPTSRSFANCSETKSVTFSATKIGKHAISHTASGGTGTTVGTSANFTLNVSPRPVTGLGAVAGGSDSINLSWTGSPDKADITDYVVYNAGTQVTTAASTATGIAINSLSPETQYCYTVKARLDFSSGNDLLSSAAGPVCATTEAVVVTPSDTVPPSITAFAINDDAEWTTSGSVTVDITATDEVGIAGYTLSNTVITGTSPSVTPFAGTNISHTLLGTVDGTKTVYVRVFDAAGNYTDASDDIKLDATPPSLTSFSINDGAAWTNSRAATVDLGASDGGAVSGYILKAESAVTITSGATAFTGTLTNEPVTLNDEDGTRSVHVRVFDAAGNYTDGSDSIGLDRVAPTFDSCAGGPFILNSGSQGVTITAGDALSQLNNTASTLSGTVNTSTVGSKEVTFEALDNAGNSASKKCTYDVTYHFVGYSSPVDNPGWINKLKAGQAVPLRWRLTDANNAPVTNLSVATLKVVAQTCANLGTSTDLLEETAAGGSGLQNLGDGYYQINWKSPTSYANSCKALTLDIAEGSLRTHSAYFMFTK